MSQAFSEYDASTMETEKVLGALIRSVGSN